METPVVAPDPAPAQSTEQSEAPPRTVRGPAPKVEGMGRQQPARKRLELDEFELGGSD